MAIIDKLNLEWTEKEQADLVFRVRAEMENCYNVLLESVAEIDVLISGASFSTVDAEIKTKGAAVRTILNQAATALRTHDDFLKWTQPTG